MKYITIKGARVNNLKSVDLKIPINKLTCFAGPSGSGKSSIAFHTLFAESKRRFLNSFPTYLKFFSERPAPVDVDLIEPVLPVFGLPQINPVVGTRAAISDTMHLTELLQSLYANSSKELCPKHKCELEKTTILDSVNPYLKNLDEESIVYIFTNKENFITFLKDSPFPNRSFSDEDKKVHSFNKDDEYWELIRFKVKGTAKLSKKIDEYIKNNIPLYILTENLNEIEQLVLKDESKCPKCDYVGILNYNLSFFSPYNALGACEICSGFGANIVYDENKLLRKHLSVDDGGTRFLEYKRFGNLIDDLKKEMKKKKLSITIPIEKQPEKFYKLLYEGAGSWCGLDALFKYLETKRYKASVRIFLRGIQREEICTNCEGSRLNSNVHSFYLFQNEKSTYKDIWKLTVCELRDYLKVNSKHLYENIASNRKILKKIIKILTIAEGIGLGHLKINRKVKTISAGEYQRLLLLKYLSYEGTGALFVFDEPSLGLSLKEMKVLGKSFQNLIELGNTVVLVEHSEYFHKLSDCYIVMGPKAGKFGGEVLYQGKYKEILLNKGLDAIIKKKIIEVDRKWIKVTKPELYNLKFQDIAIPTNEIIHVTGESGCGKSAIFINILANKISQDLNESALNIAFGTFKKITYPNNIKDVIVIDSQLNRYSSRSTVGSLTGLFSIVRKHFLNTAYAKSMGLKEGHLSANSVLGQCSTCEGKGVKVVAMQFLEDIVLECEDCQGRKIKSLYADLSDGKNTVHEAFSYPLSTIIPSIKLTPKYRRIWEFMKILKLDYLSLDRRMSSLSGGEKQRLFLLSKLEKEVKNSILFFENISFGLSKLELHSLSKFLNELTDLNNTIVIIDQDEFFQKIATYSIKIK